MPAEARHALAQQYLDLPRLYLSSDADPITDRGNRHRVCARARVRLLNPSSRSTSQHLRVKLDPEQTEVDAATLTIGGDTVRISADDEHGRVVPVDLPPGTTEGEITVETPDVTCGQASDAELPAVSADLELTPPG
jgi:hypothetical protein